MIDTCLMGYPKSFIDFIMKSKDCFYIDQQTFESLLPSKELIKKDEEQYLQYQKQCGTEKHAFLDVPIKDISVVFPYPTSYLYAYELLEKGITGLERYPEESYYRLTRFYHQDGIETKEIEMHRMTFTKQEFIESTKLYGQRKEKIGKIKVIVRKK